MGKETKISNKMGVWNTLAVYKHDRWFEQWMEYFPPDFHSTLHAVAVHKILSLIGESELRMK